MILTDEIIEKNGFSFSEFPNPEYSDKYNNVIIDDKGSYLILNEYKHVQWHEIKTEQDLIDFITKYR